MNLTIDNALHGVEELLKDKIGPNIGDPFAAQMGRLSCMLVRICANWVDDAAELRVAENAAIRLVLGDVGALAGGELGGRLAEAAQSADPGLKISVLDSENHRLRCLLVEAHTFLETCAGEAAQRLNQKIWCLLEDIERTRAPRE